MPIATPHDRARVRVDFQIQGVTFKAGEWLAGNLVWMDSLRFESKGFLLVPDCFDRFELDAMTMTETLDIDLGRAEDREVDFNGVTGFDDEDDTE